ncbi:MAG TPA: hypothetical protein VGD64_05700 [Acidisarcina sp.]
MATVTSPVSTRQQLSAVAWLRWRLLMSSFRRKGAAGEIIARIFLYPIIACFAIGPAVGAGFAGFFLTSRNQLVWLPGPLWLIFVLWQFIGLSTSTAAPSFDLTTLTRFPIRFRDYLIVRLTFGLLDAPTLICGLSLAGFAIGIGVADAALLPWAALLLFLYGACNVLFSRMLYSWLEKWLAKRRTREIVGAIFLLVSLSFQLINPLIRHFSNRARHPHINPAFRRYALNAAQAASFLPPSLAGNAIAAMHSSRVLAAVALMVAVLLYMALFFYVLKVRLHAQYLGENLSEAPAAPPASGKKLRPMQGPRAHATDAHALTPVTYEARVSSVVAACFRKEIQYLKRSGPMLYSFVTPVFMVLVFSAQQGKPGMGRASGFFHEILFAVGCAYLQLFMVALVYNCFGADGAGMQLYFYAPVRIRDVIVAKNLMSTLVLVTEVALIYLVVCLAAGVPPAGFAAMTIAWALFAYLVSVTLGNLRSLYSPKRMEQGAMRGMRLSGLSSLISMSVLLAPFSLGAAAIFICRHYAGISGSYWIGTGAFLVLAMAAFAAYVVVLGRVDGIAAGLRQDMAAELCKI